MSGEKTVRREFFKRAGGGGVVWAGMVTEARAQNPALTSANPGSYNVKAFGATGDGKAIDTLSINKAIDAAENAGGGTVLFPGGTYLSYSIHLRSNVTLHLDEGVKIIAADALPPGSTGGYDLAEPNQWEKCQDFGHNHWHNSLIWGEGLENVSIVGPGLIWGRGLSKGYGQVQKRRHRALPTRR